MLFDYVENLSGLQQLLLTFKMPLLAYANAHKNTPKIYFMCLGNKEVYCICKTCYIIHVLFSTKCCLFHNFIFFCSNNTFFYKTWGKM
jgi:hypothetical protein